MMILDSGLLFWATLYLLSLIIGHAYYQWLALNGVLFMSVFRRFQVNDS